MTARALIVSVCACLLAAPACAGTYRVQRGDSLYTIASRYGTSAEQLMADNGLADASLHAGQQLVVPGETRPARRSRPRPQATVTPAPAPEPMVAEPAAEPAPQISVAALGAAPAAPAPLPTGQPAGGSDLSVGAIFGLISKLGLVLAMAYGASVLLKRANHRSLAPRGSGMKVVETIPLGQHRSLHVVSVGNRRLLVGATPQQIGLIGDVTRDLRIAAPAETAPAQPLASHPGTDVPADDFTARLLGLLQKANVPVGTTTGEYRRPQGLGQAGVQQSVR